MAGVRRLGEGGEKEKERTHQRGRGSETKGFRES